MDAVFYQDPVFNCITHKISERFFTEGDYDELTTTKQKNYICLKSNIWMLNWEKDFMRDFENKTLCFENYENIVFNEHSFDLIAPMFFNFDCITRFLTDKILRNLDYYEEANVNSKFYYYCADFIVEIIYIYDNLELLNYLFFEKQIFEYSKAWRKVLRFGSKRVIEKILRSSNFRKIHFENVCKSVVSSSDDYCNFLEHAIDYISYDFENYLHICENDFDKFVKLFSNYFTKFKECYSEKFFLTTLHFMENATLKSILWFTNQIPKSAIKFFIETIGKTMKNMNIEEFEKYMLYNEILSIFKKKSLTFLLSQIKGKTGIRRSDRFGKFDS